MSDGPNRQQSWVAATTRRRTLAATALGGGVALLAACGGGEKAGTSGPAPQSAGGTQSAGGALTQVFLGVKSKPVTGKKKIEELRERFHPRNLKYLPGQKDSPKYSGTLRWSSNVPVSWDLAGPAASLLASHGF